MDFEIIINNTILTIKRHDFWIQVLLIIFDISRLRLQVNKQQKQNAEMILL